MQVLVESWHLGEGEPDEVRYLNISLRLRGGDDLALLAHDPEPAGLQQRGDLWVLVLHLVVEVVAPAGSLAREHLVGVGEDSAYKAARDVPAGRRDLFGLGLSPA